MQFQLTDFKLSGGLFASRKGYTRLVLLILWDFFLTSLSLYFGLLALDNIWERSVSYSVELTAFAYISAISGLLFLAIIFSHSNTNDAESFSMTMSRKKIINTVRLVLRALFLLVALAIVLYAGYRNIVPGGKLHITVTPDFQDDRVTINSSEQQYLVGKNDVARIPESFYLVSDNPLELSVQVPRAFHDVDVKVLYQGNSDDTYVKLGSQHANGQFFYTTLTEYNSVLENLPVYWLKIREGDYVLWQRNREYEQKIQFSQQELDEKSIQLEEQLTRELEQLDNMLDQKEISEEAYEQFVQELEKDYELAKTQLYNILETDGSKYSWPYSSLSEFFNDESRDLSKVYGYQTSLESQFLLSDLNGDINNVKSSMRGDYTLLFYNQSDGVRTFNFIFEDTNKHEGADDIEILLSQAKINLGYTIIDDDGFIAATNTSSEEKEYTYTTRELKRGIYRIQVKASHDIFTKKMNTDAKYLAFEGKIYSTDSKEYEDILAKDYVEPVTMYTNGTHIFLSTSHTGSYQTIKVNSVSYLLESVDKELYINNLEGITKIELEKGDVKVRGDGIFAYDENNPLLKYWRNEGRLRRYTELDGIDYVYAYYPEAKKEGDWSVGEVNVEVPNISFEGNHTHLKFDFGRLGLDSRTVKVKEIDLTFNKDPLTVTKIIEKFRAFFTKN